MRKSYSYIYCVFIVLLAFQAVIAQNKTFVENTDKTPIYPVDARVTNLKKQVKELFKAYDESNLVKFAELSHPKLFEKNDVEGFMKLDEAFNLITYMNSTDYSSFSSSVEQPKELVEFENIIYGIVPYKLEGTKKDNKDKIILLGSMVGISTDKGKNWRFINGKSVIYRLPDVAGIIYIPADRRFVNDIEQ